MQNYKIDECINLLNKTYKESSLDKKDVHELLVRIEYLLKNIKDDLIENIKTTNTLSTRDTAAILKDLNLHDIEYIEDEIEKLNVITERFEQIKSKFPPEAIVKEYKTAIETIINASLGSSGDGSTYTEILFLAKECCKKIEKLSDKHHAFMQTSLERLATLYIEYINYCINEPNWHYCCEDYIDWYKEVLELNPENKEALKGLLEALEDKELEEA